MSEASKKLDEIQIMIATPVRLTSNEKQVIKRGFTQVKEVLDAACDEILEMDREPAYAATQRIIQAIKGAVGAEPERAPQQTTPPGAQPQPRPKPRTVKKKKSLSEMEALISALTPDLQVKAGKLDCITSMRTPGIGVDAICPECDEEKLLSCIKTFDPSIRVDGDPSKQE